MTRWIDLACRCTDRIAIQRSNKIVNLIPDIGAGSLFIIRTIAFFLDKNRY